MKKKEKNTNKLKNEIKGIIALLCIGAFLFLSYTLFTETEKGNEEKKIYIREQYPFIQRNEHIVGTVFSNQDTYLLNNTNLIDLRNNKRFRLTKAGRNYNYKPSDLQYFIKSGDSINKPSFTDSIYIYRNGKEYYFLLNMYIGKDQ